MWHYPDLDPVAISLGPVSIHWYALSYLVGIWLVWLAMRYRIRTGRLHWAREDLSDLIFYCVLGLLIGGRVGYMIFYGLDSLAANPAAAFRIWEGGMSFHGGLLGVLAGVAVCSRKRDLRFFEVTDAIAPAMPLALGCGRIGNFINAELPGRVTDAPWALVFPGEAVGRHPSSLYQAALEGPVLFALLWVFAMQPRPLMTVSGLFLLGYGCLRIFSEFFREPDPHTGFVIADLVTRGQLLSAPMVMMGVFLLVYGYRKQSL